MVNPKLLVLLGVVVVIALAVKLGNPHREYSTRQFWENATVVTVAEVPQKALDFARSTGNTVVEQAILQSR